METYIITIVVGVIVGFLAYVYLRDTEGFRIAFLPRLKAVGLTDRRLEAKRTINFYRLILISYFTMVLVYTVKSLIIGHMQIRFSLVVGVTLLIKVVTEYYIRKTRMEIFKGVNEAGIKDTRELIDIENEYEDLKYLVPLLTFLGVFFIISPFDF